MILSGKPIAELLMTEQQKRVAKILQEEGHIPTLAVIQMGNNEASSVYIKNKQRMAEKLGMGFQLHTLKDEASFDNLHQLVLQLGEKPSIHAILCQYPLPPHIESGAVGRIINPFKDVDGLNPVNTGLLAVGIEPFFVPCTAKGVLLLLSYYKIETVGKKVVIVGRSGLVGRPLSLILSNQPFNATVTLCHSATINLEAEIRQADITIVAVGKAGLIKKEWVKEGSAIIDVGINHLEGHLVGDIETPLPEQNVHYSPVPGGVGPLTVAMLMGNVLRAYDYNIPRNT